MRVNHTALCRRFLSAVIAAACAIVFTGVSAPFAEETSEKVAEGLTYKNIVRETVPWAIQALELDRNARSLAIGVALGGEHILGIEPLDGIIGRVEKERGKVAGAINGDFYILQADPYQGDPIGLCVAEGELVSTPMKRSALAFMADGSPMIGRFTFTGSAAANGSTHKIRGVNQKCGMDALILLTPRFNGETRPEEGAVILLAGPYTKKLSPAESFKTTVIEKRAGNAPVAIPPGRIALMGRGTGAAFLESLAIESEITVTVSVEPGFGNIANAVGGGPRLLRNGDISIEAAAEGIAKSFVDTRHPRTAVGWNEDTFFFVTVDGRQEGYSLGMSLPELAALMKELGATEALNLDGGGSTTLFAGGKIRNRPSDKRLRPLANGIVIYESRRTR